MWYAVVAVACFAVGFALGAIGSKVSLLQNAVDTEIPAIKDQLAKVERKLKDRPRGSSYH